MPRISGTEEVININTVQGPKDNNELIAKIKDNYMYHCV